MVNLILAVPRQLHSTFIALDICFLHVHFHIEHLERMCVCVCVPAACVNR